MASRRTAFASGFRVGLLLLVVVGVVLAVRGRIVGMSLVDQLGAAMQRLAMIAVSDTAQMGLLGLICVACGLLVVLDRRRRSKVRQATC